MPGVIDVRFIRGVWLPALDFWLDPASRQARAFVSHAHADHFEPHETIWCSEPTAHLIAGRYGKSGCTVHALPWQEPVELDGGRLTLLPSGHILGAAQSWIETDRGSLLYTGDFKMRTGWSAEPNQARQAETLIMETTFGLPHFRFPPVEQVEREILKFCVDALAEGVLPVLIGYSLGKAQEIQMLLARAGMQVALHEAVYRMAKLYHTLRPDFPEPRKFAGRTNEPLVLIVPPAAARSRWLKMLGPVRKAILTGWAMMPGAIHRYQVDAAFPLSDHADFEELCRYVEIVNPKRVLTLHGYAAEFAAHLRRQGREAWALSDANQLELLLQHPASVIEVTTAWEEPEVERECGESAFGEFAALGERIAGTTSRLQKAEDLAVYLRGVEREMLPVVTRWLTGSPFARSDGRLLRTGWAVLRRALVAVGEGGEGRLRPLSRQYQDAAQTAGEFLKGATQPRPHALQEVQLFFEALADDRGPTAKVERLSEWLRGCSALEAKYSVKLITGDLRIGLKEGLVEEALARAFEVAIEEVRQAHMILGDLGEVAGLAEQRKLREAAPRLFQPLRVMLASPESTAEGIWQRLMGNEAGAVWTEPKFDGIRLQLHVRKGAVELYSRDLRGVTNQFPEVAAACEALPDCILDGELAAWGEAGVLPFQELQKRLGRTEPDLFLRTETPLRFVVFDCLYLEGKNLLSRPLLERRGQLETLELPDCLSRIEVTQCESVREMEAAFLRARESRTEGLICKDPRSFYLPGRRGMAWMKLKKAVATLDVVVVAVEQGHGKRHDMLSDYTFAVRDEESDALLVIGKAYSGLTDAEISELGERFRAETVKERGRKRHVEPRVVLEVAFDRIQPSSRHESGLALRFPRIVRIREDKGPEEIDSLQTARKLAGVPGPG